MNIKKYDDMLYLTTHRIRYASKYDLLWRKIKSSPSILKEAIKVVKNKYNTKDTIRGLAIGEAILCSYDNIDKDIYNSLINSIYTNKDIARSLNIGSLSYLIISLENTSLKLNSSEKEFALNEAKETMDMGIHGIGAFDIRYFILKNPNWSVEEKTKLVYEFYPDEDTYDEYLEEWEWNIINQKENYKDSMSPSLDKYYLYEYSYPFLLQFYNDKNVADKIWEKIEFCRLMRQIRPTMWEKWDQEEAIKRVKERKMVDEK